MALVRIFTNSSCPNSRAYNFPLIIAKSTMKTRGYELQFELNPNIGNWNCDLAFVNSNIFRTSWQTDKGAIFSFLETLKSHNVKVFWFDTTDSTWCTQFDVMPYVDKFLKAQLLADRNLYLSTFRTGRIFTDYFDKLYNSGERSATYPPARKEDIDKMGLSWNSCFENYSQSRYSFSRKALNLIGRFTTAFLPKEISVKFTPPLRDRKIPVSCRVGTSHSRPSVASHRKAVMEMLGKRGVNLGKIPLHRYFDELRNSQIAVSPFGVGEITLRDYEIIICGAALVKPDMSHLDTWPNLFVGRSSQTSPTYLAFKWDLSDLGEKIDLLLSNPDRCFEMAENAQKIYRHYLSEEGIAEFAERLVSIIQ